MTWISHFSAPYLEKANLAIPRRSRPIPRICCKTQLRDASSKDAPLCTRTWAKRRSHCAMRQTKETANIRLHLLTNVQLQKMRNTTRAAHTYRLSDHLFTMRAPKKRSVTIRDFVCKNVPAMLIIKRIVQIVLTRKHKFITRLYNIIIKLDKHPRKLKLARMHLNVLFSLVLLTVYVQSYFWDIQYFPSLSDPVNVELLCV